MDAGVLVMLVTNDVIRIVEVSGLRDECRKEENENPSRTLVYLEQLCRSFSIIFGSHHGMSGWSRSEGDSN